MNPVEVLASHLAEGIAALLCLAALAFSSLSEAALMRIEPGRARQLADEGRRGAAQLAALVANRQEVINSLILLINASVVIVSTSVTSITIAVAGGSPRWVPISSVVMIAFILVVCEVAPKTYGVRRAEKTALAVAPVVAIVHAALRPVGRLLHRIAVGFNRAVTVPLLGGESSPSSALFSDEELKDIVTAGEADGTIEAEEKEMIHGVMDFSDKVAREVMTPRTDMVCLAADQTVAEAARVCQSTGYSRLPVYEGDLDHVIGIVYAKDLVSALRAGGPEAERTSVGQIARKPAPVVPESKHLGELLPFMQRNRLHMAIVIDEYGGTAGLVTIEDLLEEIFGEIRDEHDREVEPVQQVGEGRWLIDARLSTDELQELTGVALPEGEFDSVGGFVLDRLGRLPTAGETLRWQGLAFRVEEVSENRIRRVLVIREQEEGKDGSPPDE